MVFAGADLDPDTLKALADLGFSKPEAVVDTVRGWLHGRYRATRSERTRGMLTRLAPTILDALARTGDPDGTLHRFDIFLQRLPAGIQLFALFHSNPHLVPLMARILGTSGRLADYLARNPAQFDCVLMPGFLDSLPDRRQLADELALMMSAAPDYEDGLNVLRRFTNDNRFRIGVQMLRGTAGDGTHGGFLSDVAEAALAALIPRVEAEFRPAARRLRQRRHGHHRHGQAGRPRTVDPLRPRPDHGLRRAGRRLPVRRRQAAGADDLLRAADPAPAERHHRADGGGLAV